MSLLTDRVAFLEPAERLVDMIGEKLQEWPYRKVVGERHPVDRFYAVAFNIEIQLGFPGRGEEQHPSKISAVFKGYAGVAELQDFEGKAQVNFLDHGNLADVQEAPVLVDVRDFGKGLQPADGLWFEFDRLYGFDDRDLFLREAGNFLVPSLDEFPVEFIGIQGSDDGEASLPDIYWPAVTRSSHKINYGLVKGGSQIGGDVAQDLAPVLRWAFVDFGREGDLYELVAQRVRVGIREGDVCVLVAEDPDFVIEVTHVTYRPVVLPPNVCRNRKSPGFGIVRRAAIHQPSP